MFGNAPGVPRRVLPLFPRLPASGDAVIQPGPGQALEGGPQEVTGVRVAGKLVHVVDQELGHPEDPRPPEVKDTADLCGLLGGRLKSAHGEEQLKDIRSGH